jgi:hypothetical protein
MSRLVLRTDSLFSAPRLLEYKCTDYYDPSDEIGVLWNDPEIGVVWPVENPILSGRISGHNDSVTLPTKLPLYAGP